MDENTKRIEEAEKKEIANNEVGYNKVVSVLIPKSFNKTWEIFNELIDKDNNFKRLIEVKRSDNKRWRGNKKSKKLTNLKIRFAINFYKVMKERELKLIEDNQNTETENNNEEPK